MSDKKTTEELAVQLDKELAEFTDSLKGKTIEELNKLEEEVVKAAIEWDEEVAKHEYSLPAGGKFEKTNFTKADICNTIVRFVNKISQSWEYVLGLHQMVEFWKAVPSKVPYKVIDSTLRMLGTLKFEGDKEWMAILQVNSYIAKIKTQYEADLAMTIFHGKKHDAVVRAIEMQTPITPQNLKSDEL